MTASVPSKTAFAWHTRAQYRTLRRACGGRYSGIPRRSFPRAWVEGSRTSTPDSSIRYVNTGRGLSHV
eukprot:3940644-Rhodomonas_salina.4